MIITLLAIVFMATGVNLRGDPFPVDFYDYQQVINGYSPQVSAVGGINVTEAGTTHTAFYNPALLAFRDRTTISATMRYLSEEETAYSGNQIPVNESVEWYRNGFSYLGVDSENIGFAFFSVADLEIDREITTGEGTDRYYLDYYLDAYRFSFAEKSGLLAFGFNLTFLTGRTVFLKEQIREEFTISEQFVDSKGWGYSLDFGAAVKSGSISYGLTIPNLMGKVHWQGQRNYSLQRRLQAGVQWGEGDSYVMSGISRKFALSSETTYHIGLERAINFGVAGGEYQFMPFRVGIFTEKFDKFKNIGYGIGTGYQYSIFQIDLSYLMADQERKSYSVMMAFTAGI